MATYHCASSWDFTDGRDGSLLDAVTIEAASDIEAIQRAKAWPPPNLPVALRTCLLTREGERVVWTTAGLLRPVQTVLRSGG